MSKQNAKNCKNTGNCKEQTNEKRTGSSEDKSSDCR